MARELAVLPATATLSSSAFIIIASSLGFAVLAAAAFGLWSITVTHRICGPMFVMERYLREMAAGRFPKKRPLRQKDAFKEFYDVLWRTSGYKELYR